MQFAPLSDRPWPVCSRCYRQGMRGREVTGGKPQHLNPSCVMCVYMCVERDGTPLWCMEVSVVSTCCLHKGWAPQPYGG